jgi:DNA-directed RNA polymerase I, II, and III subunit RPABC2
MADDNEDITLGAEGEDLGDIIQTLDTEEAEVSENVRNDPLAALKKHHPECVLDYAETIAPKIPLLASPPLKKDPNHKSPPFLTLYERTKIIGFRANQLSQGARPYIDIPEYVTDVGEIARLELQARRLPLIIRRPMPDGSHEYWRLSDLLIL